MPTSNSYSDTRMSRNMEATNPVEDDSAYQEETAEEMPALEEIPIPTPEGGMSLPQERAYSSPRSTPAVEGNIYERIEEMTESLIDEKWDELIAEVKKIIEWKERIEEKQVMMLNDLRKLKEDFAILHQGVLGKLSDYDSRMKDVGAELNAVGKVFKEVIPEFVENVKELKHITEKRKK